jgi:putative transcriptional regulator
MIKNVSKIVDDTKLIVYSWINDTKRIKKRGDFMKRQILIDHRKDNNLTQKQVADALGISEVYVRKIENGVAHPGRTTMLKFEKLFERNSNELFPDLFQVFIDTKCIKS